MKPRSISIFLLEGDPDGIRQAQIAMSTIHAIAFRKTRFRDALNNFPELANSGVYILTGSDENDGETPAAYIGESENVAARLQYHAGRDGKPFWVETIVLISKDENLNKAHVRYVEARLIADAAANPKWKLHNNQKADELGKLSRPDSVAMDELVDQTKTLVRALGCDLFKTFSGNVSSADQSKVETHKNSDNFIFEFKGNGYDANLVVLPSGEFAVLKGSIARAKVTNAAPPSVPVLRSELLAKGILEQKDGGLRFLSNFTFPSVSAAAAFIYGGSYNGRVAWKLSDGRTYADWESEGAAAINIS